MTAPASSARLAALAGLHDKLGDPLSKETAALRALIAVGELVTAYDEIDEVDTSASATEARNGVMKRLAAIIGPGDPT